MERGIVMSPSIISKIFRRGVSASVGSGVRANTEVVAHVAQPTQLAARLRRLELPEGKALDTFLPEIQHTSKPFPLIASAEAGNPDAMLLLSDRFTSKAQLLESSAINDQLGGNGSTSGVSELWTRVQSLKAMAMTLLSESAKRGNGTAQQKLLELVTRQGGK